MSTLRHQLSATYAHLANRTFSTYWQSRKEVLRHLDAQPSDDVLEMGSGHANWSAYLAPRVQSWTGLELDMGRIRGAFVWRSAQPPYFPTRTEVDFVCASAEDMPFPDAAFDKAFSTDVIEHIPDDYKAARELYRVLRPGGRAVLTTLLEARPSYIRRLQFPLHEREYTTENLSDRFVQAGFEVTEIFYFYYMAGTIARELQVWSAQSRLMRVPGVEFLVTVPLRAVMEVEQLAKIGEPGGIGLVATKPAS